MGVWAWVVGVRRVRVVRKVRKVRVVRGVAPNRCAIRCANRFAGPRFRGDDNGAGLCFRGVDNGVEGCWIFIGVRIVGFFQGCHEWQEIQRSRGEEK